MGHLYKRDSPMLFLNVPGSLHCRDSLNAYKRMGGKQRREMKKEEISIHW